MKKLLLASCLLVTSTVFADTCTFNLKFNTKWANFKNWIIIITDVSNPDVKEVVGGPTLFYGKYPENDTLKIDVPNCTKSTQIGLFAHAPGKSSTASVNEASSTSNTGFKVQAFAPNSFLEGMARCVGDISPQSNSNIELVVGSIGDPGDFAFTSKSSSSEQDSWTKAQLGVVCQNPHLAATESDDTGD
ncbi:hypothetical protein LEAN103870_03390 [Legionella anisa]|uniref:Uncharacterized protein n=1 Tax=Legionella anisa TaxID=28082 RepID=A0AAX0WY50_9GAMM|nr:hypothetical protein [Legionella anisa]AWN72704.1 hypothetical protein DLD14_01960 [Legionella anisa]KTC72951.1 hypothetical protein Lani_1175 [Legionella anisa]MBN5934955.1 hypothetical protein [Legionella anisa]MCW8423492.1 hypothetical protein [Legionella anisa]MCW8447012.1 hypothetical protein [Legionella anisa]